MAPLVLGVVGGVLGLLVLTTLRSEEAFVGPSWVVVVSCSAGFLGAGLTLAMPRIGGTLLLLAGIGIIFAVALSWIATLSALSFLSAAGLVFFGKPGPEVAEERAGAEG